MSSSKLFGTARSSENTQVQIARLETVYSSADCSLPLLFVCLFVCGLYNDAVSSSAYIESNDVMNNKLKGIWKEAVIT
jgi:hypothetical protein